MNRGHFPDRPRSRREDQVARPRLDDLVAEQRAHPTLEDEAVLVLARVQVERRRERIEADGDRYALTEQLFPRGIETPLHVQPEDDETFYVLEGEVTFFAGDDRTRASAGTVVHVPRGTPHGFRVESETARMLVVTTPQHVAFFRAVGDPATELTLPPPGEPDMGRVMAAAGTYKIDILGPLPR